MAFDIDLRAGQGYPAAWSEFQAWFPDDAHAGATLRASAGRKVSYVRRAGLPKHGVPPVTCGCARSAVAGRRRGHGGHYPGQDPDAPHDMVRRCLVHHQPEAWGQCAGSPACVGVQERADCLDDASQAPQGDGPANRGKLSNPGARAYDGPRDHQTSDRGGRPGRGGRRRSGDCPPVTQRAGTRKDQGRWIVVTFWRFLDGFFLARHDTIVVPAAKKILAIEFPSPYDGGQAAAASVKSSQSDNKREAYEDIKLGPF